MRQATLMLLLHKKKNTCRSGTSQPASLKSAVDFFIFFPVILTKLIKGKMVWLFLVTVWSFVTRFYVVDIT